MNAHEFMKEYLGDWDFDKEIQCRCLYTCKRSELITDYDIEQTHPKNRNNSNCNFQNTQGCHKTKFECCPLCKRALFADNTLI